MTEFAGGLDAVLTNAALGQNRRFLPGKSGLRMARNLARNPGTVANRGKQLGGELVKIVTGGSTLAPAPKDRRFADPAWKDNVVLKRLLQTYLAAGSAAESLVDDAYLDWRDAQRMRFIISNLVEALAPSNNPLINPLAWKAFIDSGGVNAVKGVKHLLADLRSAPRVPSMVDNTAFEVGRNIATTPGRVVHRTEVFELIQYAPQTETVRERPLLIVPPTINKFYVLDLAPERSMVEYLVQQGQQVFMIAWRNPAPQHADWDVDIYGLAVLDALDAVEAISGADQTVLTGVCSGGILASLVMGHLAAIGQDDRVAGFGLAVTTLDQSGAGAAGALLDDATAAVAVAASKARGYLDGNSLAEVFAWLRPSDLIWNYWVNNYLLGKKPPAFDILFWNADTTRMTAGLHRDFVQIARSNAITAGTARMLGTDVNLGKVMTDTYIVAGAADHICPWQGCYRSTQMFGGQSRFVLSTSGHIAALVNPTTNPKASFLVAHGTPAKAADWQADAVKHTGSWWMDFADWLADRSGPYKPAPSELGAPTHPASDAAPGVYVYGH